MTRETSIYLDPSVRGRGIGGLLYPALLDVMAEAGVHTAVVSIYSNDPFHTVFTFTISGTGV